MIDCAEDAITVLSATRVRALDDCASAITGKFCSSFSKVTFKFQIESAGPTGRKVRPKLQRLIGALLL